MREQGQLGGLAFPKAGRGLIGLLIANVVVHVVHLLLLRANQSWVQQLYLQPSDVFERGYVWQLVTYWWLHSPASVGHLLFNMLMLYWFGSTMEHWWGTKRFFGAYAIFALGGALLTLLVALVSTTAVIQPLLPGFWSAPHLGASGAVVGVTVAWGLTQGNREIRLLLMPAMKGTTFVLIVVAFELLVALSFEGTSSTSHFGGIAAAVILCKGLWKPSNWRVLARRADLERKKKKIEAELRVIRGGKDGGNDSGNGSDPSKWN